MIYLDNASTTSIDANVLAEMLPYFADNFGNPSLSYSLARKARKSIHEAEKRVMDALNSHQYQVIFTASGSESNNIGIKALLESNRSKGKHIICSNIEHPSVSNVFEFYQEQGYELSFVSANREGLVEPEALKSLLRADTVLVSIMYVNNEIGTIQNIKDLCHICHENGTLFHCDGVQAIPYLEVDLEVLDIDTFSISAHKLHGPKGVGALLMKKNIKKIPVILGGAQEKGMRAGTENVPGIVGLGKALEVAKNNFQKNIIHVEKLRNHLYSNLNAELSDCIEWNGSFEHRIVNNLNFRLKNISSALIMSKLDLHGICISAGAACSSGSLFPSKTVLAIHPEKRAAQESIRITLSKYNTIEELNYVIEALVKIIKP